MNVAAMHDTPVPASIEDSRPDVLDTLANAWRARGTGGLSPAAGLLAWYDWALHLSLSPGKQRSLLEKGLQKQQRLARYAMHAAGAHDCPACIEPLEQDQRFAAPAWQQWPFNVIHQGFLLHQQWWHNATTGVRGMSRHHENMVTFAGQAAQPARQGAAQAAAPGALRRARCKRPWLPHMHRAVGAGSALCGTGLATVAVQRDPPGLLAAAAVVAQRHDRRRRRERPS